MYFGTAWSRVYSLQRWLERSKCGNYVKVPFLGDVMKRSTVVDDDDSVATVRGILRRSSPQFPGGGASSVGRDFCSCRHCSFTVMVWYHNTILCALLLPSFLVLVVVCAIVSFGGENVAYTHIGENVVFWGKCRYL